MASIFIKHFDELSTLELYELLKLRTDIFVVEQDCVYSDLDDKDQQAYHLLFKNNSEIIGYLRILNPGVSYPESSIGRVVIKISARGQKHGVTIMKEALKFLHARGEEAVKISAQEHLYDFYHSLGFQKVTDTYLEDGIPHIGMLLHLSPS